MAAETNDRRCVGSVLVVLGAAPTVVLLATDAHGPAAIALIAAGAAGAVTLGRPDALRAPNVVVWGAIAGIAVLAVARPPLGSHDLWSYASYGRIIEHYHANPYTTPPAAYAGDPVLARAGWPRTPSVYGPLFVAMAAVVSRVAGTNLLALRLAFQVPVAVAALGAIALAQRYRRDRSVVAMIGLQPFLWVAVVNGGHNDMYLGLAAIGAIVLMAKDRPVGAMVVVAVAALVKPVALLAAPVLLVATARRSGAPIAARAAAVVVMIAGLGVALAPWSVTGAARATRGIISRASPWRIVTGQLVAPARAGALSIALVAVIAAAIAWRSRGTADLATATALALAAYAFVGSYTLVWYCAWAVAVGAVARRRAVTVALAAHAAALFAAYQVGTSRTAAAFGFGVLTMVLPILFASYFAYLMWTIGGRRGTEHDRHSTTPAMAASPL